MSDPVGSGDRRARLRHRLRQKSALRTARIAAISAAATLAFLAASLGGWWAYSEWQLGRIELTNRGPVATVRVLDERSDEPILEPFEVVKSHTLALPGGDYRLRIDADGRLGRTYRVAVNHGETVKHRITLEEGRLLGQDRDSFQDDQAYWWCDEPMPYARPTVALELTPGKWDIIELAGRTLIRRDGATGKVVWNAVEPKSPHDPGRDPSRWIRPISRRRWMVSIVEPAVDLDGDGTRDVLLAFSAGPGLLAVSGADGSMIWNHVASADGPGGPQPEGPELPGPVQPASRPANLVGEPALADVDGDGTPDIIATMIFHEFPAEVERRTGRSPLCRRFVQAVSGRSGRQIWAVPIDAAYRPFIFRLEGPALPVAGRRASWVGYLDCTRYLALDVATGRPRSSPIELGFEPVRPIQHADLDGDGEPDILALAPGPAPNRRSLAAFSVATGKPLWTAIVGAEFLRSGVIDPTRAWPRVIDLDGDGPAEVIVPDSGSLVPKAAFRGISALDGRTGKPRWTRPLKPENGGVLEDLYYLREAPDLDGDGVRDVVAVNRFEGRSPGGIPADPRAEPVRIHVDALGGRDGRLLWSWHVDQQGFAQLWEPRWFGRGKDGWPLLAIALGGRDPRVPLLPGDEEQFHPASVYLLEVTTGSEQARISGLAHAGAADLDGDGLLDLWGEFEGQLRAYRGEPPECWRALGNYDFDGLRSAQLRTPELSPAPDLDGDGIADVVGSVSDDESGHATATARSGRDGHLLWKSTLDAPWFWQPGTSRCHYRISLLPPPHGDLDGDGTPDVIVERFVEFQTTAGRDRASIPLRALSGRDGRLLWKVAPLPLGFEAFGDTWVLRFEPRVFGPGEPPDLLVFHRNPFFKPNSPTSARLNWASPSQRRLTRISGRTGRVVRDWPLEDQPSDMPLVGPAEPRIVDLDGDGRPDVALVFLSRSRQQTPERELRAVSLVDGTTVWSRRVYSKLAFGESPPCEIVQGTRGSLATVYSVELLTTPDGDEMLVHALDARDGSVRWTWRSGVREDDYGLRGGIEALRLGGEYQEAIGVAWTDQHRRCRILLLDDQGRELVHRDLPTERGPGDLHRPLGRSVVDLDGDGRDEIMVWHDHLVSAWDRNLKDLWRRPAQEYDLGRLLRGGPNRPRTMILQPMTGVEATTGRVLWTYPEDQRATIGLLDPGDSERMPRVLISTRGATVCRQVLRTTPAGAIAPPTGERVPADLVPDDPRWTRPLPWVAPVRRVAAPGWIGALLGLALVNVVLPLGLLRLSARRRPWTLRLLMLLPIAAAIPLVSYLGFEPLLPAKVDPLPPNPKLLFALATAAGLPMLAWACFAIAAIFQRRGRAIAGLVLLTVITSLAIAAIWLLVDRRLMPAVEHYGRSGWMLVGVPGAYAAGVLLLVGWPIRRFYRWLRRPGRRATATS